MLRSIVLISLLISSVCAFHLEMHKVKSTGEEVEEDSLNLLNVTVIMKGEIPADQLPGLCWACKWAMGKLRSHITNASSKEEIKRMLGTVCDNIGFLKYLCRLLVNRYMGTLIEELSTTDSAKTICVNIGIC